MSPVPRYNPAKESELVQLNGQTVLLRQYECSLENDEKALLEYAHFMVRVNCPQVPRVYGLWKLEEEGRWAMAF
jgi:hypothetical protein